MKKEHNENEYPEFRASEMSEYIAYLDQDEEALAAEEEAYEALLFEVCEPCAEEYEHLTYDEYERYMNCMSKFFANEDDPSGLEVA